MRYIGFFLSLIMIVIISSSCAVPRVASDPPWRSKLENTKPYIGEYLSAGKFQNIALRLKRRYSVPASYKEYSVAKMKKNKWRGRYLLEWQGGELSDISYFFILNEHGNELDIWSEFHPM